MRIVRVLGAGAVVAVLLVSTGGPAAAQTVPGIPAPPVPGGPPPAPVPEVPAEAGPAQQILGPAGWSACNTAATAMFLAVFAGGLVPALPVPADLPVSPLSAVQLAAGFVNPAVGAGCGLFGPPTSVTECSADGGFGALPFVAVKPAGLAVSELRAVEGAAATNGAPTSGAVSGPVGGALGCGDLGAPSVPDVGGADVAGLDDELAAGGDAAAVDAVLGSVAEATGAGGALVAPAAPAGIQPLPAAPGAGDEVAALASATGARWTLLRILGVALSTAVGLAMVVRWLTLAPAAPAGTGRGAGETR